MHAAEMELARAEKVQAELRLEDLMALGPKSAKDSDFVKRLEQVQIDKIVRLQQENEALKGENSAMREKYIKETSIKIAKLSETIQKLRADEPREKGKESPP